MNAPRVSIQHIDPEHAMDQDRERAKFTRKHGKSIADNFTGSFAEKCEWMRQKQARKKRAYRRREP